MMGRKVVISKDGRKYQIDEDHFDTPLKSGKGSYKEIGFEIVSLPEGGPVYDEATGPKRVSRMKSSAKPKAAAKQAAKKPAVAKLEAED